MKCGDGAPLEDMGGHVQPRDVGQNRKNNASLAQITCLRGGSLLGQRLHKEQVTQELLRSFPAPKIE